MTYVVAIWHRSHSLRILLLVQVFLSRLLLSSSQASDDFLEYDMFEELPAGTCVIQLTDSIELRHKYGASDLRALRFSFLTQPNLDRQYFTIDQATGEIRNAFRVDREKICPRKDDCVLKFDVVIQPIKYFQIIKVKVEIKDINDNAPSFPERLISHQISEFAELGTAFVVPAATDPDAGMHGIDRYALVPVDGKFELSTRDTADGGTDLRLILRERLDREVEDHHLVAVLAIDGGDPPKTGSISVNITVQDANDNSPEFDNASYEIFVSENTPQGTVITKVWATDRDIGLNAAIVYEFSKHTAQEYGHLFGIKSESGKIYLKNNLDYETGSIYLLSVTANDRGPDNLPAHASVIVRIEDINDHRPHISVNTLTVNSHAEVRENAEIGMFVAHLSVVDEDSGDNGKFLCAVDDRNFVLQPIYSSELKLVTASRLDREQRDSYELSISCKDYGLQPQSSVVPLKVKVIDENDHTPQFQKDYYEAQIAENNEIGTTLFQVVATDGDTGPNGEVLFKADADLERFIDVNTHTGVITSATSFDYEQMNELVFYLTATDVGNPPRASTAKMRLVVLDADDHRPTFISPRFSFSVLENQLPWTEVGIVVAHDNDSSPYNAFSYSLEATVPDVVELFELNANSGKLITRESLDRERRSLYHLTVYAVTSGESASFRAYTASASVTVRVDDVNDNSPIFTYPSAGNESISLSALAPRAHCVVRLRAVDFDAGPNANLTYQLISSTRPNLFRIVPSTGDVLVASDLSKIALETVVLRLAVRDGGQPQLSDHTQLGIVISRDIPFVAEDLPLSILASEDMVVVLSFTLAIILLAIAIIITIICIFRRRSRRYDGAGGRSGVGPGEAGHGNGLNKTPYASEKKPVLNCSVTSSNGKLQYSDGGKGQGPPFDLQSSTGNGKTTAVVNAFVIQDAIDHSKTLNDVDSARKTGRLNDKKGSQQQVSRRSLSS